MWERMTGNSANEIFTDTAKSSAKVAEKNRKRKSTQKSKERRRAGKYSKKDNSISARKAYSRHDGGIEPDDNIGDISPQSLDELKSSFYDTQVAITIEERENIEKKTRQQSGCTLWKEERLKRITASHTGSIAKMKKTTKRSNKVKELIYSTFRGNKATMYGMLMEDIAKQKYVAQQQRNGHPGLFTEPSGLVVSLDTPWLASSPDGTVVDPSADKCTGFVEYKNPFTQKDLMIGEACNNKTFCLEKQEKAGREVYSLKRRHNYYYQIQCQMFCCDVDWCDFVVNTEKDLHIERICVGELFG